DSGRNEAFFSLCATVPGGGTWHKICFGELVARMQTGAMRSLVALGLLSLGCGSLDPALAPQPKDLRINEVVSNNEGVWIDERGEADDYVELYNASDHDVRLSDYV